MSVAAKAGDCCFSLGRNLVI